MPFRQLLLIWVHTRNWRRAEEARHLELTALELKMRAMLEGANVRDADKFVEHLTKAAERLRLPEGKSSLPVPLRLLDLPPEQLAFLGRKPKEEPSADE